jgi:hypothetical protein
MLTLGVSIQLPQVAPTQFRDLRGPDDTDIQQNQCQYIRMLTLSVSINSRRWLQRNSATN